MKLTIATEGAEVLTWTALPVDFKTTRRSDLTMIIDDMFDTMCHNGGIGLAANQVSLPQRIIVVNVEGLKTAIINPVIKKRFGSRSTEVEGCLSYPGLQVKVKRYNRIIVEGVDGNFKLIRLSLKGLQARCVLHEVAHLDGRTIAD